MTDTLPPPPPNPDDGQPPTPRKLTDELISSVAALILGGNFRNVAARRLDVTPETFSRWMALGRNYPTGIYARLRQVVLAAEAEWEARAVGRVMAAGADDASHTEWLLERKCPQRWGRYRGELGKLKRELADRDRRIEDLQRVIADMERALGTAAETTE